jgi:predicted phage terminase large subunit-like protein
MTAPLDRQRAALAAARLDFSVFLRPVFKTLNPGAQLNDGWYLQAMSHALTKVGRGETKRLLVTMPPRHLKSICGSVAFPAWMLGNDPSLRFLVASYSAELSNKLLRDFRAVVESPWYRQCFPEFRIKRATEIEVETTRHGLRRAVSLGGSVTGLGGDILIVDDLMKAADAASPIKRQEARDFIDVTFGSRLNDQATGRLVAFQQRLHEDDPAAYMLDKGNFTHLDLQAIAEEDEEVEIGPGRVHRRQRGEALCPEHQSLETLESIRRELGAGVFAAQYQQRPVAPSGELVRWDQIQRYEERLEREAYQMVVQSWDLGTSANPTSDWSVCTTWGFAEGVWWLLDLERVRLDYPELKILVLKLAKHWRTDIILVEQAMTGISLIQDLWNARRSPDAARLGYTWNVRRYLPRLDTPTRLATQAAKLQEGRAILPAEAPWLRELKLEMLAVPRSRNDDQVDSITQFLELFGHETYSRGRRDLHRRESMRR